MFLTQAKNERAQLALRAAISTIQTEIDVRLNHVCDARDYQNHFLHQVHQLRQFQ